jgi:hypothetical protein
MMALFFAASAGFSSWQSPQRCAPLRCASVVCRDKPLSYAEQQAKAAEVKRVLEAANAKLESLNEVEKAPASWADLGLPDKGPAPPAVSPLVSAAPLVVGAFSVLLFLLNAVGLFGDGPDLDALVEEWSKL